MKKQTRSRLNKLPGMCEQRDFILKQQEIVRNTSQDHCYSPKERALAALDLMSMGDKSFNYINVVRDFVRNCNEKS